MNKFILFVLVSFLFSTQSFAQQIPRDEKIDALRVAFITRQLQLSSDEAKVFWPVHDAYQKDMQKLMQEHRAKKGDELELEEKMLELRKKYKPDFLKAISEEKFNRFLRVEREFREIIRKELEKRRGNMPPGRRQGMDRNDQ